MTQGMLYVISAPSGTGKSSLIQALLKTKLLYEVQVSVSHTTRSPRPGEIHSKHYFFVSQDEFKKMIAQNAFLEYAEVFGNYYGTERKTVEENLKIGIDILLDIDWQGAKQVREKMPKSHSIFILPPSKDELNRRLRWRGQDYSEVITKRMTSVVSEISHYIEYDYLIINDNFNIALRDLKNIIQAGHLRIDRQKQRNNSLINKLLTD